MEERPFSDNSFQKYLNEEKLMGSQCMKCNTLYTPPRPICEKCYSTNMKWVEMTGKGQLTAFTCISIGPPAMIAEGYGRKNPYISGVVELEEGTRVDARIVEIDGTKPEDIKIGTPLTVEYQHRGEGDDVKTFLAFKPA